MRMTDSMDDSPDDRQNDGNMDSDNECDHRRLILKKNLSWTNSNSVNSSSLAKLNSLKTSRSNPHVLDAVTSNARSTTTSRIRLATSQLIPNCFQPQTNPSDDAKTCKLAPLAGRTSASTLSAESTHQTLTTPTSIQLNAHPNSDLKFQSQAVLGHCKVNSQLTPSKFIFAFLFTLLSENFFFSFLYHF